MRRTGGETCQASKGRECGQLPSLFPSSFLQRSSLARKWLRLLGEGGTFPASPQGAEETTGEGPAGGE